ncbi:hypothetical protein [Serratia marcescens]|uniref:hypothetical protein n=2 Tax=Serratia marcescens TaxID=615 RepID=UPI0007451BAE|nr:hypothetical protein [Serratia marcescens]EJD6704604.1 hypothetical protein [Serratia marcescens]CUY72307.1 Uncharacterised protein [Serratia marcescens]CVD71743.1 Uncharacterised protein [Serratia marcescens]
MKNTFGDWNGILLVGMLLAPIVTHAQTEQYTDIKTQCRMANAELNEAGELFNAFTGKWLSGSQSDLKIDRKEFAEARVKNFNKQHAAIRSKYSDRARPGLDNPMNIADDVALRLLFVVNALQQFSIDGDKAALKTSWKEQHKAMTEDAEGIKKLCAKSGR